MTYGTVAFMCKNIAGLVCYIYLWWLEDALFLTVINDQRGFVKNGMERNGQ